MLNSTEHERSPGHKNKIPNKNLKLFSWKKFQKFATILRLIKHEKKFYNLGARDDPDQFVRRSFVCEESMVSSGGQWKLLSAYGDTHAGLSTRCPHTLSNKFSQVLAEIDVSL